MRQRLRKTSDAGGCEHSGIVERLKDARMLQLLKDGLRDLPDCPLTDIWCYAIDDTIKTMAEAAMLINQTQERMAARDKFLSERSLETSFQEFVEANELCDFSL